MSERAVWTRVALPGGPPLDLLAADFRRHRYAPHTHEEFAVGVTLGGLETIAYRGGTVVSGPGSIVVLEPGEPHTGGPAGGDGFAYRALYAPAGLLGEGLAPRRGGGHPHFPEPVLHDPRLVTALHRAYREIGAGVDRLETESRLLELLTQLALRHAAPATARPARGVPGGDALARLVRDRLAERLLDPPSLTELAAELGLSRYQVLRAFRERMGMPPFAWLAQHRVARARRLLDAGHPPAAAAALAGFADQAHLTRWFRRVVGVTPGVYRRGVHGAAPAAPAAPAVPAAPAAPAGPVAPAAVRNTVQDPPAAPR